MASVENPGIASRLGRAAYDQYWSRPTTMEHHVEQLEGVYRSILSTQGEAARLL